MGWRVRKREAEEKRDRGVLAHRYIELQHMGNESRLSNVCWMNIGRCRNKSSYLHPGSIMI